MKDSTCFKNPNKPSFIDLLLTKFPKSFLKSQTLETGLSGFHKLTLTVLKTEENRFAYAKQRNCFSKLLKERKRQYFENMNLSSITDNKFFWKTGSPLFTEKISLRATK